MSYTKSLSYQNIRKNLDDLNNTLEDTNFELKHKLIEEIKILLQEIKQNYKKNQKIHESLKDLKIKEIILKSRNDNNELRRFIDTRTDILAMKTINQLQTFKTRALDYYDNIMNESQELTRLRSKYQILAEIDKVKVRYNSNNTSNKNNNNNNISANINPNIYTNMSIYHNNTNNNHSINHKHGEKGVTTYRRYRHPNHKNQDDKCLSANLTLDYKINIHKVNDIKENKVNIDMPKSKNLTPIKFNLDISEISHKDDKENHINDSLGYNLKPRDNSKILVKSPKCKSDKEYVWPVISPILHGDKNTATKKHGELSTPRRTAAKNYDPIFSNIKKSMIQDTAESKETQMPKLSTRYDNDEGGLSINSDNQSPAPLTEKSPNIIGVKIRQENIEKKGNNSEFSVAATGQKVSFSFGGQNDILPIFIKNIMGNKEQVKPMERKPLDFHNDLMLKIKNLEKIRPSDLNSELSTTIRDDFKLKTKSMLLDEIKTMKKNLETKGMDTMPTLSSFCIGVKGTEHKELWKFIFKLEETIIDMNENFTRLYQDLWNDYQKREELIKSLMNEQNTNDLHSEIHSYKQLKLRYNPNDLVSYIKSQRNQANCPLATAASTVTNGNFGIATSTMNLSGRNSHHYAHSHSMHNINGQYKTSSRFFDTESSFCASTYINNNDEIKENNNSLDMKYSLDMDEGINGKNKNNDKMLMVIKNLQDTINALKESNGLISIERDKLIEANKSLDAKVSMLTKENENLIKLKNELEVKFENQNQVLDFEKKKIEIQKNMLNLEKQNLQCTRKELEHLKELLSFKEMGFLSPKNDMRDIICSKIRISQVNPFYDDDEEQELE